MATLLSLVSGTGDNIDQADPVRTALLLVKQPYRKHNGGGIVLTGRLPVYWPGDGGSAGDPQK
jgi:hypothetical protein